MDRRVAITFLLGCTAMMFGCAHTPTGESDAVVQADAGMDMMAAMPAYGAGGTPQLFDGMGPHPRRVTTESTEANEYFAQGLTWVYSFNHDEAVLAFTKCTELDPSCAMGWWGISLAQGPNYNDPMMNANRSAAAWEALQRALDELDNEAPVERALVEALEARYAETPPKERDELDAAFADAMADVWKRFPNDTDVGTIYAESMMVLTPWELYECDRTPAHERTETIVATLDRVLELEPNHAGANHLMIHAVEPSADPSRGLPAADRLSDLVPGSGHMQHMPSHIYVQTGMWDRSIEQNTKAMEQDDRYRALAPNQGIQHMYMTHNSHMLAFSAMMVGREAQALDAANQQWTDMDDETLEAAALFFDPWMCSKYDVMKRFGRWDDLLDSPEPPAFLPVTKTVWHAHRAIAYAAKKDFEKAEEEYDAFCAARIAIPTPPIPDLAQTTRDFLDVSNLFIKAEIALQKEDWERAARLLEAAAILEDDLGYGEPPMWLQPVRHTLGAVYLEAGQPANAERAYREDLAKWPENGWSLFGLSRALEAQGRTEEAASIRERFDTVWANADAPITSSCLCLPEA